MSRSKRLVALLDGHCILYTVPSRLTGRQLELQLYHERIVGYLERHPVVELPRKQVSGKGRRRGRCINYRHVIGSLRLKPRALIYCTWDSDLLPNPEYRQIWQELKAEFDLEQAAKIIVEGLYIAAIQDKEQAVYDKLLPSVCSGSAESLATPEPVSQAVQSLRDADPLGIYRIPSDAGTMVLCAILTRPVRTRGTAQRTSSSQTRSQQSTTTKRKKFYRVQMLDCFDVCEYVWSVARAAWPQPESEQKTG